MGNRNTKEIEGISKWLVSNEIPVTKENICKAVMLQDVSRLDEQQYKDMVERNVSYTLYFSGNTRGAAIEKEECRSTPLLVGEAGLEPARPQ